VAEISGACRKDEGRDRKVREGPPLWHLPLPLPDIEVAAHTKDWKLTLSGKDTKRRCLCSGEDRVRFETVAGDAHLIFIQKS
jgi:hypothetical protein